MYDFEDLVLEQEATLQKIAQFLNVQSLDLDPNYLSDSRKNINIFHSNLTQGQSDLIDQNINYIKQINIEAIVSMDDSVMRIVVVGAGYVGLSLATFYQGDIIQFYLMSKKILLIK